MMPRNTLTLLFAGFVLTGCHALSAGHHGGYHGGQGQGYGPKIPPGHMPPPGLCRVWRPGVPPGHQAPPGPCNQLRHHVPPGAYLIRG